MIRQLPAVEIADAIDAVLATHPNDELEPMVAATRLDAGDPLEVLVQRGRFRDDPDDDPADIHGELLLDVEVPTSQLPRDECVPECPTDGTGKPAHDSEASATDRATLLADLGPEHATVADDLCELLAQVPVVRNSSIRSPECIVVNEESVTFATATDLTPKFDPSEPVPIELRRPFQQSAAER